jgi:hypothetical protein
MTGWRSCSFLDMGRTTMGLMQAAKPALAGPTRCVSLDLQSLHGYEVCIIRKQLQAYGLGTWLLGICVQETQHPARVIIHAEASLTELS